MSVGEYFNIGDPALQIRADEDGMKDPLNLLREAFDIGHGRQRCDHSAVQQRYSGRPGDHPLDAPAGAPGGTP